MAPTGRPSAAGIAVRALVCACVPVAAAEAGPQRLRFEDVPGVACEMAAIADCPGDCWVNKKVKICVAGRVASSEGRCVLRLGARAYVDGRCAVESYTPFGEFYLRDACGASSRYSAHVAIGADGTATATWSGDPPRPSAGMVAVPGRLTRQGACWANDGARICAYKGKPAEPCEPPSLPDGHSEQLPGTVIYTPGGRCEWDLDHRHYTGGCGVAADNNDDVKISAGDDSYKITTTDGVTSIAWNGGAGGDTYDDLPGAFERRGTCWVGKTEERLCVDAPPLTMSVDKDKATHWNVFKATSR